jgi:hypothetical protein
MWMWLHVQGRGYMHVPARNRKPAHPYAHNHSRKNQSWKPQLHSHTLHIAFLIIVARTLVRARGQTG